MPNNGFSEAEGKLPERSLLFVLEKAWEIKWAARLVFVGLFVDVSLIVSNKPGIFRWSLGDVPLVNVGWVILVIMSFCALTAFIFPAIFFLLRLLVLYVPNLSKTESYRSEDSVFHRKILERALRERSQFLLDWHNTGYGKFKKRLNEASSLSDLLAGVLLLCGGNVYFGSISDANPSIISTLIELENEWPVVILFIFVLWAFSTVVQIWKKFPMCYLYFPRNSLEENDR